MEVRDDWLAGGHFSWDAGYALASACKLAYRPPRAAAQVIGEVWGMSPRTFERRATTGFVAIGERAAVLAFRGTDGFADWLGNLDLDPVAEPGLGGRVHSGFVAAYQAVAADVAEALSGIGERTLWITGHSLGGALAVIAAGAQIAHRPAGLVTFGQPRMLKPDARDFVDRTFGNAYLRIVNDDDIVARIPPNYGHTGSLLHFDFTGSLLEAGEALDSGADGPPPLSDAEFQRLQDTARMLDAVATEGAADVAVEGLIPGLPAHRIDAYVNLMRQQARRQPATGAAEAMESLRDAGPAAPRAGARGGGLESGIAGIAGAARPARPVARQPVLVRLRGSDWKEPAGLVVQSRFGMFATAMASAEDLQALAGDPGVVAVELSRDPSGLTELDRSVPFVRGDEVQRPPLDERGAGALVGVIDTGIDILHDAFLDAHGTSRILAIWDQRATDPARTPHALAPGAFGQDYGTLHLAADIARFRADAAAGMPSHPAALRDPQGHGSHVAGIAAGRAVGGMADGMAPEAAIVCVIAAVRQGPDDPPSLGYSFSHVDALAFLRRVADGGTPVLDDARPLAVNVSLGMNAGAHDGTTTLEAAFDGITGGGRDPGIVIVKSAGNERGNGGHARVSVFQGGILPLEWDSSSRFRDEDYLEGWFDGLDDIAFQVVDPAGTRGTVVDFANPRATDHLGGNEVRVALTQMHPDNGDNRLTVTIRAGTSAIQPGTWTLEAEGRRIVSADGMVHVWIERTGTRAVRFRVEDPEMTLSVPGTARTVVCVGASDAAIPLRLLGASSWGLTRDGRAKPDLCAPGHGIVSVRAGAGPRDTVALPGTSMAAPHVTGALALVLSAQARRGLPLSNAMQLQTALARTVRGLPSRHNVGAGFGVLDARALFDLLVP
ncbi:S8 family serine peptidase [Roseivivax isoporae]|nr:S8 family serine peptidase [Roseivivax isoporae]